MRSRFLPIYLLAVPLLLAGWEHTASAQPDAAMMQAIQSNLDSQRAIASAQQAAWQNQNIEAAVRRTQDIAAQSGVNQGGDWANFQGAPMIQWGAGGNRFLPAGRLQQVEMMAALQELNGVDLRSLNSWERAQCKAAARKLRLSLNYGYGLR
jgi:hypothetical protein